MLAQQIHEDHPKNMQHCLTITKPASRVCVGDVLVTHHRHSLVHAVRIQEAQVRIETRDGSVFTYARQDALQVI